MDATHIYTCILKRISEQLCGSVSASENADKSVYFIGR